MGGGGTIIIRNAIKTALTDPMVHGLIPADEAASIDAILAKDTSSWTSQETHQAAKVFHWLATHT